MPTYEYICSKCDHHFDILQSITESALKVCPKDRCSRKRWGKGKVKRAISSGGGIIFKGSGFYITDYRSDSYKEAAKKDTAPAAAPAGESKSGGETKTSSTKSDAKTTKASASPK